MYCLHDKVSTIRYSCPVLTQENPLLFSSKEIFTPVISPGSLLYKTLFEKFDKEYYLSPRLPIDLGKIDTTPYLTGVIPNVLRLPLKFPHTSYRVPQELAPLESLLRYVSTYEATLDPKKHEIAYCHLTFDRSEVEAGYYHRFPGFHGDGFQGTKIKEKSIAEHSYILTTAPPTELCLQPFFLLHLDEAKHNIFEEFDRQACPENLYALLEDHLYLFDPYIVHRSPSVKKRVRRLFIRITYTFTELEHPKNTVNPLFEGQTYGARIDIRENLRTYEFGVPYKQIYGIQRGEQA